MDLGILLFVLQCDIMHLRRLLFAARYLSIGIHPDVNAVAGINTLGIFLISV